MIYHAETKHEVLSFLRKIGHDTTTAYADMTEYEQRDGPIDWIVVLSKCTICGYRPLSICPIGNEVDTMKCDRCGNMTLERETDNSKLQ